MKFEFKKKFGQNFLRDNSIIAKITDTINTKDNDLIIEIGPGSGALTKKLVEKKSYILAYEIDNDLRNSLATLESDRTKIIFDDFLKRNIFDDIKDIPYNNLFIVGNLPYYITTPIIMKIINEKIIPKEMVFMVQKEVAERFSANVGSREYGSITVFLNYYFEIKNLFVVNRQKFYPVPNVDSAVIKFVRRDDLDNVDVLKFNELVRDSFQFKRKNLRNNLKKYDLGKMAEILGRIGKTLSDRAENLSYKDFVYITNAYYK